MSTSKHPQPPARPGKPPQTIRGGFIVVRRQERTGRLLTMHGTAYEHASAKAAEAQAAILAERFGCEFAVFAEVSCALPPPKMELAGDPAIDADAAAPAPPAPIPAEPPAPAAKRTLVVERRKARLPRP